MFPILYYNKDTLLEPYMRTFLLPGTTLFMCGLCFLFDHKFKRSIWYSSKVTFMKCSLYYCKWSNFINNPHYWCLFDYLINNTQKTYNCNLLWRSNSKNVPWFNILIFKKSHELQLIELTCGHDFNIPWHIILHHRITADIQSQSENGNLHKIIIKNIH